MRYLIITTIILVILSIIFTIAKHEADNSASYQRILSAYENYLDLSDKLSIFATISKYLSLISITILLLLLLF